MTMWLLTPLILLVPEIALAAPRTFEELMDLVLNLLNAGVGVMLILAIVIYFYGVTTSLMGTNKGETKDFRAHITWGIIALFIMFSIWGILSLLRNTLFGGGGFASGSYTDDDVTCLTVECVIDD